MLAFVGVLALGEMAIAVYDRTRPHGVEAPFQEAPPAELHDQAARARLIEYIDAHRAAVYFATLQEGLPVQCTLTIDTARRESAVSC